MASVTRLQITIDCQDPSVLVPFWALALGYEPRPAPGGFATWRDWYVSVGVPEEELGDSDCQDRLQDPAGHGPMVWFQVVPERKAVKNRLHVDVLVADRARPVEERRVLVDAKVAELVAAGATVLHVLSELEDHYGVVLQDPEGNELCIA
jgi:hypothetical protein